MPTYPASDVTGQLHITNDAINVELERVVVEIGN